MAARKTAAKKKKAPAKKKAIAKKKAPAKKKAAKRSVKKAVVAAPAKPIKARYSKTQMVTQIAENTELSRKQVQAVMDELSGIIEGHITKRGCGDFVLPGLMKIVTVKKPARKARKGINPFTGEETMFKAKPASIAVKIRPLKKMKEMVV